MNLLRNVILAMNALVINNFFIFCWKGWMLFLSSFFFPSLNMVLWISHLVVDLEIDFVKETMEDLVMKGALELVLEAYSLKFLPPVHQWQPHQL